MCPCVVGVSCHLLRVWLGVCPGALVPQLLSDGVLEHFAALLQADLMEVALTTKQCVGCWVRLSACLLLLLSPFAVCCVRTGCRCGLPSPSSLPALLS